MKLTAIILLGAALTLSGGVIWVQHTLTTKDKEIAAQARQARINLAAVARLASEVVTANASLENAQAAVIVDTQYIDRTRYIVRYAQEAKNDIPKAESCEALVGTYNGWVDGLNRLRSETAANN